MKKTILLAIIFTLIYVGCNSVTSGQYTYRIPGKINDGINVGKLDEAHIDSSLIIKAVTKIYRDKYDEVHSMLIFKENKLVFEEYFQGHKYKWDAAAHRGELVDWTQDMTHSIMSDTKSITSLLIGIAIDKGFIQNVHQSIFDYLPDHQNLNRDRKDKITIEHLLTMTSGLEGNEWDAPYSNSDNPIIALWFPPCEDPITCILEKPLINEPGTNFSYFGGNMIILGEIIKNATKMSIDEFSRDYLFNPLGIDDFVWADRFKNGVVETAGGLRITPRAMAKIGLTFLNKGIWNEQRIISEQWIEKSMISFSGIHGIKIPGESGKSGYSYSWWIKQLSHSGKIINIYFAHGWGGQNIMIVPELSAVVVFTGGNYTGTPSPFKILEKYIMPSFKD